MSTEQQHDADAYRQELARINYHQHEADAARVTVFRALAALGVSPGQADEIVSQVEAGAIAAAHTWISESSAPHGSEPQFEDGWFEGVRAVSSDLLRIADTTAAQRGRATPNTLRLPHLEQPDPPTPKEAPAGKQAAALDAKDVLAAAERFPWAVAAPGERHWPDGSDFLDVALSAVRTEEREGYIEHLQAFVEQHRPRLEEMLRGYGPGSRPASHGRYALIGQPETLVIVERMESAPFLLRSQWAKRRNGSFEVTECQGKRMGGLSAVARAAGSQVGTWLLFKGRGVGLVGTDGGHCLGTESSAGRPCRLVAEWVGGRFPGSRCCLGRTDDRVEVSWRQAPDRL
ncbi:hypothetical protein [Streptomyces sp. A5-4]|uniref:hypothetical protein n=1 Tax=Streptomyces sp. A5-4 TaxID=3384771 RepID=UPI003DA95084